MQLDIYGDTLCALVSAGVLASSGHQVRLHLNDGPVRQHLQSGTPAYSEPGLAKLMSEQLLSQQMQLAYLQDEPQGGCDAVFLAMNPGQLQDARTLADRLAAQAERDWLLVNQSPFPIGSSESLQQQLREAQGHARSVVACLPDFLQEGHALADMQDPEQLVLGCTDGDSELRIREIYRPYNQQRDRFLVMTPREAEFTKMAITGMLVTRVSFINDMAMLAENLDVDIEAVCHAMGRDPRIGGGYLQPGIGFGGPGLAGNLVNLGETLQRSGLSAELLNQVVLINERQKEVLFRKLWTHYQADLKDRVVAIWGGAFKPGTGRIDNAPVIKLLEALWAQGVKVRIHDPEALPALLERYGHHPLLHYAGHAYAAVENADALMLVTEWKQYWSPDFKRLKALMRTPLILDGRNAYDPQWVRDNGFTYYGVGR